LRRTESNRDQERRCREHLDRIGIPREHFVVLADEAISGTTDSRPASDKAKELAYSRRLRTSVSTEQSRVSRGDNAKAFIMDVVFYGGRFITVTDGIDTTRKGWKTLVGISEIHPSRSKEDTA
jgi:hypothetical protein